MLRSFRLGEADRVLHVYTADRGRVGAVAKGVRRTKSRFGARLEPLSHVELMLHQGSGELQTVTGRRPARVPPRDAGGSVPARRRPDRCGGDAAPLSRAGGERARLHRADPFPRPARRDPDAGSRSAGARLARPLLPAEAALGVGLQAPPRELRRVRRGRRARRLSSRRPAAPSAATAAQGRSRSHSEGVRAIQTLVATPLADAGEAGLTASGAREALAIVRASYEHQGGFRLRTLSA